MMPTLSSPAAQGDAVMTTPGDTIDIVGIKNTRGFQYRFCIAYASPQSL